MEFRVWIHTDRMEINIIEGKNFADFKKNLLEYCKKNNYKSVTPEIRGYFGDVWRRGDQIPVRKLRKLHLSAYSFEHIGVWTKK